MVCRLAAPLLIVVAAVQGGCTDRRADAWRVAYDDPTDREQARSLQVDIHEGGCGGAVVFSAEVARGETGPDPAPLEPGLYGFRVRAGDDGCRHFMDRCVEERLPRQASEPLELRLRAEDRVTPTSFCSGLCDDGRCMPLGDAGITDVPAAPTPLSPLPGAHSGSVRTVQHDRPTFRWTRVASTASYEIQLTTECEPGAISSCEVDSLPFQTIDPAYTPSAGLPSGTMEPVGLRYYWRVRACNAAGCSPYSAWWYVEVGRTWCDLDGNGLGDLSVGARGDAARAGSVFVRFSDPMGTAVGVFEVPSPDSAPGDGYGASIAVADVDADGFADLVVGAPGLDRVYAWFGAERGFGGRDPAVVEGPAGSRFGAAVAVAGDLDLDGHVDVLIGAPEEAGGGRAYVLWGGARAALAPPTPLAIEGQGASARAGAALDTAGDFDADGHVDVVIASPGEERLHLFRGPFTREPRTGGTPIEASERSPGAGFGLAVVYAGDVDGDGFGDLVVSEPEYDSADVEDVGRLGLVRGGPGDPSVVFLPPPVDVGGARAGAALTIGADADFDGRGDVLLGAPGAGTGRAVLMATAPGEAEGIGAVTDYQLPPAERGAGFGVAVASVGDFRGENGRDLAIGAPDAAGGQGVVRVYGGARADSLPTILLVEVGPPDGAPPGFGYSLGRTSLTGGSI